MAHIEQTSDGGFIIAGGTDSFSFGHSNAWVIKLDADGIKEWNRTFRKAISSDRAVFVQQISDMIFRK